MSPFLQCDAPGCDHVETVAEVTADLVGKPCPKCGADLLTQEDFDAWGPVVATVALLRSLAEVVPEGAAAPEDSVLLQVSLGVHDGALNLSMRRVEGQADGG